MKASEVAGAMVTMGLDCGLQVTRAGVADGLPHVAFRLDLGNGPMFNSLIVDVPPDSARDAAMVLIETEVDAMSRNLHMAASMPKGSHLVDLGARCPVHPSDTILGIDYEKRTLQCSGAGESHPFPLLSYTLDDHGPVLIK